VGSTMFVDDIKSTVENKPGATFEAGAYTFTFEGLDEQTLPNGDIVTTAAFSYDKDGKPAGTVNPGQISFFRQGQTKLNADVTIELLHDVFIVLEGADENTLSLNVKINPLISWAWFGFALTILGTGLASYPKKQLAA
ncbi:MAG: cytochrome c-type biogenesis CcmF C-terminal domain-containing protein, partial [Coriobacteriia bacterium]|nr:cytochrome c-type biogenesis CcmF C-terminal domain-containing protein [Coriobacteriia bacterium]